MFCVHCGAELEEGVRFCGYCGEQIIYNEFIEEDSGEDFSEDSSKVSGYLIYDFIALIMAAILGISCFLPYVSVNYLRGKKKVFSLISFDHGKFLLVAVILIVVFLVFKVRILQLISGCAGFCIAGKVIYDTLDSWSYAEMEIVFYLILLSAIVMLIAIVKGIEVNLSKKSG